MALVGYVLIAIAGLLILTTKTPLAAVIANLVGHGEARRMQDPTYALLRREVEKFGRECEALPYERLLQPAEELSTSKIVDGVEIAFSAEAFNVAANGDIGFCVDANAKPKPKGAWVQPSYQFFNQRQKKLGISGRMGKGHPERTRHSNAQKSRVVLIQLHLVPNMNQTGMRVRIFRSRGSPCDASRSR
jgi:hypothetical protein